MSRPWTRTDDRALEQLRGQGRTRFECAVTMDRTPGAIHSRCVRLDIPYVNARRLDWIRAVERPHTIGELCARFKVCRHAARVVKWRLKQAGYAVVAATKGMEKR